MSLILKGKFYDSLKWITLVLFPGLGTLYFTLAAIWSLPYADQVTKTDVALCAFLGLLLGLSHLNYQNDDSRFDGTAFVDRFDPVNNPHVMLKERGNKVPGELRLKVQETAPPVAPPKGNRNQDTP